MSEGGLCSRAKSNDDSEAGNDEYRYIRCVLPISHHWLSILRS